MAERAVLAAARAGLYVGHELKQELVVGPDVLQPPDFVFNQTVSAVGMENTESSLIKKERATSIHEPDSVTLGPVCMDPLLDAVKLESSGGDDEITAKSQCISGSLEEMPGIDSYPVKCDSILGDVEFPTPHDEKLQISDSSIEMNIGDTGTYKEKCSNPSSISHKEIHTSVEPCISNTYKEQSLLPSDIKRHKQKHSGKETYSLKTYSCDICKKYFASKAGLIQHIRTHSGVKPRTHPCDICGKHFTCASHLQLHKRSHTGEKPYSCDICKKNFALKSNLTEHRRVHTGEKPYSCNICGAQFAQSSHLKLHNRRHTGEKPYACQKCNKRFSQASDLRRHERTHSGEKPYPCLVCNKYFANTSDVLKHSRIHTGEKPFSCDICGKQFTEASSVKCPHTKEKPYPCPICKKNFSRKSNLKAHKRIHTGDKAQSCYICQKQFAQASDLKLHKQSHLGENLTMASNVKLHKGKT